MREQGFIFIDILVTALIVAVLFSVAVPAYGDYLNRSRVAEGIRLAIVAKLAIEDYYAYRGKLPMNNAEAGLPPPEQLMGNYVSQIAVNNGEIKITFGNLCPSALQGKLLVFYPQIVSSDLSGAITWQCGGHKETTVDSAAYLPRNCKEVMFTFKNLPSPSDKKTPLPPPKKKKQ